MEWGVHEGTSGNGLGASIAIFVRANRWWGPVICKSLIQGGSGGDKEVSQVLKAVFREIDKRGW